MIGRYRLIRHLGEGGMGTVWLAEHPDLGIDVAIKTMESDDEAFIARFLQEARSAALIDHKRVARTYDSGSVGDLHYMVMGAATSVD
jgi:serine/threonine-protein kinase